MAMYPTLREKRAIAACLRSRPQRAATRIGAFARQLLLAWRYYTRLHYSWRLAWGCASRGLQLPQITSLLKRRGEK
jgi:hypothetical protein